MALPKIFTKTDPKPETSPSLEPSPNNPQESGEAFSPGWDSGAHLDNIGLPDFSDEFALEGEELEGGLEAVPAGPAFIGKDIFFANFRGIFAAPNLVIKPPLKSLPIPADDETARAASDELYELCEETPFLNFLIRPESKWAKRVMVVGAFAVPKAAAVMAELEARKAPGPGHNGGPPLDMRGKLGGGIAEEADRPPARPMAQEVKAVEEGAADGK